MMSWTVGPPPAPAAPFFPPPAPAAPPARTLWPLPMRCTCHDCWVCVCVCVCVWTAGVRLQKR